MNQQNKTPIDMILDGVNWKVIEEERSDHDALYATHEGILEIAGLELHCFQLSNGDRVIDQQSLEDFLGCKIEDLYLTSYLYQVLSNFEQGTRLIFRGGALRKRDGKVISVTWGRDEILSENWGDLEPEDLTLPGWSVEGYKFEDPGDID